MCGLTDLQAKADAAAFVSCDRGENGLYRLCHGNPFNTNEL